MPEPLLKNLAPSAQALLHALPEQLAAEAQHQLQSLLKNVSRYLEAPYAPEPEPPCVWRYGAARLLARYAQKPRAGAPLVLFIPSLINRYTIMDIMPERSFARHVAAMGHDVLMLDWGAPSAKEAGYNAADYVTEVLIPAVTFAAETSGRPVVLAGYCMGGVLSLAASKLAAKQVLALALIGTPWDFASDDSRVVQLDDAMKQALKTWLTSQEALPAETLQLLFAWQEPWLFQQKFERFATLTDGSAAFREFIALEHWVNDGVPLARRVATDTLLHWAQENRLVRGQWVVAGKQITAKGIRKPAFVAIAQQDHIVPPKCAEALATQLPHATLCRPATGHVGMMAGSKAKREMWEPFVEWLNAL